jgi:hypothetical protein
VSLWRRVVVASVVVLEGEKDDIYIHKASAGV